MNAPIHPDAKHRVDAFDFEVAFVTIERLADRCLEESGGDYHYLLWAIQKLAGGMASDASQFAEQEDGRKYLDVLMRFYHLIDTDALIVNPDASAPAAKDARSFIAWLTGQIFGGTDGRPAAGERSAS
ncbi:MAG: hypothetical protein ABI478_11100 [Propionivibrio sp.]